jgi:hypothetical protein
VADSAPVESAEPPHASLEPPRHDEEAPEGDGAVITAEASSQGFPVKVFQVNEEFNFLVISLESADWAKEGTTMELAGADATPVATAQLTEVDSEGFAVVQITKRMDSKPLRRGDLLFARLLPGAIVQ